MVQCIDKETEQRSGHDKGSLLRFSPQLHYSGWDRHTDLSGQEKTTIQAEYSLIVTLLGSPALIKHHLHTQCPSQVHATLYTPLSYYQKACRQFHAQLHIPLFPHPSHHLSCTSSSAHRMAYQMGPGLFLQRGEATQNRSPLRLVQPPNQLVPVLLKLAASLMSWRAQQLRERDSSQQLPASQCTAC